MYLSSWRAEKRPQRGIEINLGFVWTKIGPHRPALISRSRYLICWYKKKARGMDIIFFEGQLIVLFIIVIIQILPPVMHGKIIHKTYMMVKGFVFYKMPVKFGDFHELVERRSFTYQQHKHYVEKKPFHVAKLEG